MILELVIHKRNLSQTCERQIAQFGTSQTRADRRP